jgi:hypothetical protein
MGGGYPPFEERIRNWAETPGPLETDCWLWQGALNHFGYGKITWDGVEHQAHRASWIFHVGSIPDDLCVLHHCDIPSCVNPDHLWLGTRADNMADMWAKGRASDRRGQNQGRSPLTEPDVAHIRYFLQQGWSHGQLAERYRVTRASIQQIKEWRSWTHVPTYIPKDGEPPPTPPPISTTPTFRRYTERTENDRSRLQATS